MTENGMLDQKVSKKHYPRTNNDKVLEFVFDKDPNLYLRKHKIAIKGYIEVEDDFVVENGWVSKLFANVNVELDSQSVSVIRNKYDLPKNQITNFKVRVFSH